jgi:hypothetical protein
MGVSGDAGFSAICPVCRLYSQLTCPGGDTPYSLSEKGVYRAECSKAEPAEIIVKFPSAPSCAGNRRANIGTTFTPAISPPGQNGKRNIIDDE